jgi:hypothetical protein
MRPGADHYPVAHSGVVFSASGFIAKLSGNLAQQLAVFGQNPIQPFMFKSDTPYFKSLLDKRGNMAGKKIVPAQRL